MEKRRKKGGVFFEIRVGIHSGELIAGVVGLSKFAYDIWGNDVNLAARMESACETGEINISESTYQLVKSEFKCRHRGMIATKNTGEMDMYFV
jgi:class 3 adenylate cyclase